MTQRRGARRRFCRYDVTITIFSLTLSARFVAAFAASVMIFDAVIDMSHTPIIY